MSLEGFTAARGLQFLGSQNASGYFAALLARGSELAREVRVVGP